MKLFAITVRSSYRESNLYLASIEKPVVPEVASDAYSTLIGRTEQPVTRSMLGFFLWVRNFVFKLSFLSFNTILISSPVLFINGDVQMKGLG